MPWLRLSASATKTWTVLGASLACLCGRAVPLTSATTATINDLCLCQLVMKTEAILFLLPLERRILLVQRFARAVSAVIHRVEGAIESKGVVTRFFGSLRIFAAC